MASSGSGSSRNESVFEVNLGNVHAEANDSSYQKWRARRGNAVAAEKAWHAHINSMAAFGFDPERNQHIIDEREAQLRNRAMYAMLNNLSNNKTSKNSKISKNSRDNKNGVNAEAHANRVSELEAQLHMKALEEMEPGKHKSGLERYMFNRAAADDRFSKNVINSIIKLLPKKDAIHARAHREHEKHIDKRARNEENKLLVRKKEIKALENFNFLRRSEADEKRHAEAIRREEYERRVREEYARILREQHEERAREEYDRRRFQEFLHEESMRPFPGGLVRANATHPNITGRRKSKRVNRTKRNVTRRR